MPAPAKKVGTAPRMSACDPSLHCPAGAWTTGAATPPGAGSLGGHPAGSCRPVAEQMKPHNSLVAELGPVQGIRRSRMRESRDGRPCRPLVRRTDRNRPPYTAMKNESFPSFFVRLLLLFTRGIYENEMWKSKT